MKRLDELFMDLWLFLGASISILFVIVFVAVWLQIRADNRQPVFTYKDWLEDCKEQTKKREHIVREWRDKK